jgi:hypothetical protein
VKRSLSITIIAILQGFISVASLASGVLLLLLMSGSVQIFSQDLVDLPLYLKGLVALGLAISLFGTVVTYGLWKLRLWGWLGSLIFQIMCIANNGLALLAGQEVNSRVYFSTAISIALIGALWMPSVRELIEGSATEVDAKSS